MSRSLHKAGALALGLLGCAAIATATTLQQGGLRITVRGRELSCFNAGCPAPE